MSDRLDGGPSSLRGAILRPAGGAGNGMASRAQSDRRISSVQDLISAPKGGTYLEPAAHTQSSWQELSDAYGVDLAIPPDYARVHYGLVDARRDLDLKRGDSK